MVPHTLTRGSLTGSCVTTVNDGVVQVRCVQLIYDPIVPFLLMGTASYGVLEWQGYTADVENLISVLLSRACL